MPTRLIRRAVLLLAPVAGVRWEIRGLERLDPSYSYVFTPNHASPLDVPRLYVVHPRVRFAAAAELFRRPFLGPAMRALGTIPIERRRPEVARAVLADVAAHPGRAACLVVFPEGRLAPAGELLPFKSGPFILAIQAGLPIAPVAVHHASAFMPRGSGLRLTPGGIVVEVLDPVPTGNLGLDDRHTLKVRVRSALLGELRLEDGGRRPPRPRPLHIGAPHPSQVIDAALAQFAHEFPAGHQLSPACA